MRRILSIAVILGTIVACSSVSRTSPPLTRSRVVRATPTPTLLPSPTPIPRATPPAHPAPPEASSLPETDLDSPRIRVLIKKAPKLVLPGTGRPWFLSSGDRTTWMWGPLTISSSAGATWWQLGAFSKRESAEEAIARARGALGEETAIDESQGEDGLIRVRVPFQLAGKDILASAGFPSAFQIVSEPQLRLEASGELFESAEEIVLRPAGPEFISLGSAKYRGQMIARSDSGKVLLINELNLEAYLRGVVPGEMGPAVFPALEALKAQAVAARTYAIAHLGDHRDEGYDICATPACQVYGGAGIEHPLTDRAIRETAGIIATWEGKAIDAMYTSTCGGHTEDSSELFSGRKTPYLKGVACAFDTPVHLEGLNERSAWLSKGAFRAELAHEILGLSADATPAHCLDALAAKRGVKNTGGEIQDAEHFAARLLEISGLGGASRNLSRGDSAEARLLFLADLFKVPLSQRSEEKWESSWAFEASAAAMEMAGLLQRDTGELNVDSDGHARIFPKRADSAESLPEKVPLWEEWGDSLRMRKAGDLFPGTSLVRYREEGQIVALIYRSSGGPGEADRRSAWREWIRDVSFEDLATRLGMPKLKELKITKRASSKRVIGIEAVDTSGRRKRWQGFQIRRVLDLPETLFDMVEFPGPGGKSMIRFLGRGWGHGVGLCQNGAYGLARAGKSYDEILHHYYTGISLERLP